jgi:hypothetical protein
MPNNLLKGLSFIVSILLFDSAETDTATEILLVQAVAVAG